MNKKSKISCKDCKFWNMYNEKLAKGFCEVEEDTSFLTDCADTCEKGEAL